MRTVSARFTDHQVVARAVSTLTEAGLTETAVIPLADVDPPLAEPVLLAVRVDESHETPIRDFLRDAGGLLSDEQG
jgi:hypothetical protein